MATIPAQVFEPSPVPRGAVRVPLLCLREARPVVLVMFLSRILTVVVLVGVAPGRETAVLCGVLGWMLAVVAVYLGNGVSDLVEDRANGSLRPLARGLLDPQAARYVVGACAVLAVVLAARASVASVLLTLAFLALGHAYSVGGPTRAWKASALGSATVGVLGMFLTYADGALLAGRPIPATAVVLAVLLSLWTGVVGATKDLGDDTGDAAAGRRTLPILLGHRRATVVIACGIAALVTAALVVAGIGVPAFRPAAVVLAVGGGVLVTTLRRGEPGRGTYRLFMITQWMTHVAATLG